MTTRFFFALIIFSMMLSAPAKAAPIEFLPVEEAYELSYYLDGSEFVVDWIIEPGYYLYRDKFKYTNDENAISDARYLDTWETIYDPTFDEDMRVYYEAMSVRLSLAEAPRQFPLQITYQGCADAGLCYPPQKVNFHIDQDQRTVNLVKPVQADQTAGSVGFSVQGQAQNLSFILAVTLAFLGGLILNLMPCVFPVLSVKAYGLLKSAGQVSHAKQHGLAYTVGVVLSFVVIGAIPLLFKGVGDWVGWGFQLQSPVFISVLLILFFVLAMMMMGWLEFGGRLMGVGENLTHDPGMSGSFFTGILATLVATPCVAPFMGTAIGYALSHSAPASMVVFISMGLGMALPILLLSFVPAIGRYLPKPGPWMHSFRQFLAFPLFGTALWLLYVLAEMKGKDVIVFAGAGLVFLGMFAWPGLKSRSGDGPGFKSFKRSFRVLLIMVAFGLIFRPTPPADPWQPYTPDLVEDYQARGFPVFIDVTAAWCITCKVNEKLVLSGRKFFDMVDANNIQLVRADWTSPTPEVDALISQYQHAGVPLYIWMYRGQVNVLPQILTPELIRQTFSI